MVGPIWLQPPCPHAIKHVQRVSVLSSISNGVQEELKSLSVLLFRLFQVLHDHRRHGEIAVTRAEIAVTRAEN